MPTVKKTHWEERAAKKAERDPATGQNRNARAGQGVVRLEVGLEEAHRFRLGPMAGEEVAYRFQLGPTADEEVAYSCSLPLVGGVAAYRYWAGPPAGEAG